MKIRQAKKIVDRYMKRCRDIYKPNTVKEALRVSGTKLFEFEPIEINGTAICIRSFWRGR